MTKIQLLVLFALLSAIALSQIRPVDLTTIYTPQTIAKLGPEFNDPQFIKLIDNYFGCRTWQNGQCIQCSQGYLFNNNGICCKVDQHCEQFNRDVGICQQCYNGYQVAADGSCQVRHISSNPETVGCAKFQRNRCVQCSVKHFNNSGVCQPVDSQCRQWSSQGTCTECYQGYAQLNGACALSNINPSDSAHSANPLCKKWSQDICQDCADRTYRNNQNVCTQVDNNCNTYDRLDGLCLTCYIGYDLVNGNCVYSPSNTALPTDAGCKTWQNSICQQCSFNWVFDANNVCIPVHSQCKTHQGLACTSCYRGYDLADGACVYSPSNTAAPVDGGCKTWNVDNLRCQQCAPRWVANANGLCVKVNDDCREHQTNGQCTSCYRGYDLADGVCTFSPSNTEPLSDAGCHIWNYETNACKQCSPRWYQSPTGCFPIDNLCQGHDQTGACTSCYKGYDLVNNICVYSPSNTVGPSDVGCRAWDNGVCSQCSHNWVFNANRVCTEVNGLCRTHQGSACTSCYGGYDLVDGACVYSPSNTQGPVDTGCRKWSNGVCSQCSPRWVLNADNVCVRVNDDCREHQANGQCSGCYLGYDLADGVCVYSTSNTTPIADAGCHIWNYQTNSCGQCSNRWVLINSVCQPVSALCRSNDQTGACVNCYIGYDLNDGNCVFSPSNLQGPLDKGCRKWENGVCSQCSNGFAFNADRSCIQVSDLCKTSEGLQCTSCYKGYILNNGACTLPQVIAGPSDSGCSKWNWDDQVCTQCGPYWYLNNGQCNRVSDYCKTYSTQNGLCLSCYKGYNLNNGVCQLAPNQQPKDAGCANWNWDEQICRECSKYYVNVNGVCQAVSPLCRTYDVTSPRCTSCFQGYGLNAETGSCEPVQTTCRVSNAEGCTSCYNGYALYQKNCVPLSGIADIALYYAECCPQKLESLRAEGRIPK